MKPLPSRFLTGLSIIGLLFPLTSFAASPQQILTRVFKAETGRLDPAYVSAEVKLDFLTHQRGKTDEKNAFHVSFWTRALPATPKKDNEGGISLDGLSLAPDALTNPPPFILDRPVSIRWKSMEAKTYLQVEQLPQSLLDMVKTLGVNPDPLLGQWISTSLKEAQNLTGSLSDSSSLNPRSLLMLTDDLKELEKQPPLRATMIERRSTDDQGHTILRIRAKVNPAFIEAMRRLEAKDLNRRDRDYYKQLASLNKKYAEMQRLLRQLFITVTVDDTASVLKQIEMEGTFKKTEKGITNTYHLFVVARSKSDNGTPVIAPTDAITFEELFNKLKLPETPTSTEDVQILQAN